MLDNVKIKGKCKIFSCQTEYFHSYKFDKTFISDVI